MLRFQITAKVTDSNGNSQDVTLTMTPADRYYQQEGKRVKGAIVFYRGDFDFVAEGKFDAFAQKIKYECPNNNCFDGVDHKSNGKCVVCGSR